jgi:hypothetical protein
MATVWRRLADEALRIRIIAALEAQGYAVIPHDRVWAFTCDVCGGEGRHHNGCAWDRPGP